jgi:hypothetical protein
LKMLYASMYFQISKFSNPKVKKLWMPLLFKPY